MDATVENTSTHRGKTGTPDSTTDLPLVCDTDIEGPDTHDPLTHTRANRVYNEGCISSSYSDIVLEIGGETIVVKGTRRTELIISHMINLGNDRFSCNYCNFESHDQVNVFTHIGYIHHSSPCKTCGHMCFQTCSTQEKADLPTSTEFAPIVLSSFVAFLGDFSPRTSMDPKLEYIVKIINGDIAGW